MTDLSTLTGPQLSALVAELRGWTEDQPSWCKVPHWFDFYGEVQSAVSLYRPDRDIGQAMELLTSLPDNYRWTLDGTPEALGQNHSCAIFRITSEAWEEVGHLAYSSLARAVCEAWCQAMEKAKEASK